MIVGALAKCPFPHQTLSPEGENWGRESLQPRGVCAAIYQPLGARGPHSAEHQTCREGSASSSPLSLLYSLLHCISVCTHLSPSQPTEAMPANSLGQMGTTREESTEMLIFNSVKKNLWAQDRLFRTGQVEKHRLLSWKAEPIPPQWGQLAGDTSQFVFPK